MGGVQYGCCLPGHRIIAQVLSTGGWVGRGMCGWHSWCPWSLHPASASCAPVTHPLALPVFPLPSSTILGSHHQAPGDVAEGEAQRPPQAHTERGAPRACRCLDPCTAGAGQGRCMALPPLSSSSPPSRPLTTSWQRWRISWGTTATITGGTSECLSQGPLLAIRLGGAPCQLWGHCRVPAGGHPCCSTAAGLGWL